MNYKQPSGLPESITVASGHKLTAADRLYLQAIEEVSNCHRLRLSIRETIRECRQLELQAQQLQGEAALVNFQLDERKAQICRPSGGSESLGGMYKLYRMYVQLSLNAMDMACRLAKLEGEELAQYQADIRAKGINTATVLHQHRFISEVVAA